MKFQVIPTLILKSIQSSQEQKERFLDLKEIEGKDKLIKSLEEFEINYLGGLYNKKENHFSNLRLGKFLFKQHWAHSKENIILPHYLEKKQNDLTYHF